MGLPHLLGGVAAAGLSTSMWRLSWHASHPGAKRPHPPMDLVANKKIKMTDSNFAPSRASTYSSLYFHQLLPLRNFKSILNELIFKQVRPTKGNKEAEKHYTN